MKKIIAISLLASILSGCITTNEGKKRGVLVKVAKEGVIWGTYEGELIRGGLADSSGANGSAFHFTLGQFKSKLIDSAMGALLQNKPIIIGYHCEAFTAPWRGETNCFADSITEL